MQQGDSGNLVLDGNGGSEGKSSGGVMDSWLSFVCGLGTCTCILAQWTVTFFLNECSVLACILKVVCVFIKEALETKTLGANTNMEI